MIKPPHTAEIQMDYKWWDRVTTIRAMSLNKKSKDWLEGNFINKYLKNRIRN